jgi:hypothetical protein
MDPYVMIPVAQVSGDDETVPAIVAGATEQHGSRSPAPAENFGNMIRRVPAGILHEHDSGNAQLVDRDRIDAAYLVSGQ